MQKLIVLARNFPDFGECFTNEIRELIHSEDFLTRHKTEEKHFTRKCVLTFPTLIYFLINGLQKSIQLELNSFFKVSRDLPVASCAITKEAFIKARKKFSHSAFEQIIEQSARSFEKHGVPKTWYGFRLAAIDGSTIRVPDQQAIIEHFGTQKNNGPTEVPMARISQAFDPLNKISLHAAISPLTSDERGIFLQHLYNTPQKTLFLLDRGYPAAWLFQAILEQKQHFCVRVQKNWNKEVVAFLASGLQEKTVEVSHTKDSAKKLAALGLREKRLKTRLIRVELDSGEIEVLATSLLDREKYPIDIFKELYFRRWLIEEDYKLLKCRAELENFSGKSVESVYQDFFARICAKNLALIFGNSVTDILADKEKTKRKHPYQVNFTHALGSMKNLFIKLFQTSNPFPLIQAFLEQLMCSAEPIRKNRKAPRKETKKTSRRFYGNYKRAY